jgi:hypothetical protein
MKIVKRERKIEIKYVNLLATVQKPLAKLFETYYTFAMRFGFCFFFHSSRLYSLLYFVSQRIISYPLCFFHLFSPFFYTFC